MQRICVGGIRIESLVDCRSCAETERLATPGMHGSIRAQDSCQPPFLRLASAACTALELVADAVTGAALTVPAAL